MTTEELKLFFNQHFIIQNQLLDILKIYCRETKIYYEGVTFKDWCLSSNEKFNSQTFVILFSYNIDCERSLEIDIEELFKPDWYFENKFSND
jgi:hypothetical protein